MSFVEGVGDEVLVSASIVVVLLVCFLICLLSESISAQRTLDVQNVDLRPTPERSPGGDEGSAEVNSSDTRPEEGPTVSEGNSQESALPEDSPPDAELPSGDVGIRQRRLEFFRKPSSEGQTQPQNGISNLANGSAVGGTTGEIELPEEELVEDQEAIHIRLKYLDDTERTVQSSPSQLINDFKRVHFAEDLSNNKFVRLINNGQVLQDTRTLQSYGLVDNSVVHVQVQSNQVNRPRPSEDPESELDLGQFLWPILGVVLLCVWVVHFQYKEYFSTSATVALFGLSGLFLTVVWGQHSSRTTNATPQ